MRVPQDLALQTAGDRGKRICAKCGPSSARGEWCGMRSSAGMSARCGCRTGGEGTGSRSRTACASRNCSSPSGAGFLSPTEEDLRLAQACARPLAPAAGHQDHIVHRR